MLHHLLNHRSQKTNRGSPNNNETWYPWHLREACSHRQQVPAFLIRYGNQRHSLGKVTQATDLHSIFSSSFKSKNDTYHTNSGLKSLNSFKNQMWLIFHHLLNLQSQTTEVHPITMKLDIPDIYERPVHTGNRSLLF